MSKKLKHSAILNKTPVEDIVGSPLMPEEDDTLLETTMKELNATTNKDDVDDKYNALHAENIRLTNENSVLVDKIDLYITEIEDLKRQLNKANANLSSYNVFGHDGNLIEINERLQKENDTFLAKISELTFENANYMSKLQDYERRIESFTHAATQNNTARLYKQNGYSAWN